MIKKLIRKIFSLNTLPKPQPGCIDKQRIRALLPPKPVILEAGAADGGDTLEMSSLFSDGQIYALEPIPVIYEKLKANVKSCRNVKTFQLGLSDTSGKTLLNLSTDERNEILSSSSILKPKEHVNVHPNILFNQTIEIDTITIDEFCQQNKIPVIDFLWLDLQGIEFQTLKASPKTLKSVKVIHTEVSLIETYEQTVLYPEFRDWLIAQGFSVEIEELPFKDMGNVVFVRH